MQFYNNNKEEKKLLHSVCEVEMDGKKGLLSLYDDLPYFEYDLTIDNVSTYIEYYVTFNKIS